MAGKGRGGQTCELHVCMGVGGVCDPRVGSVTSEVTPERRGALNACL